MRLENLSVEQIFNSLADARTALNAHKELLRRVKARKSAAEFALVGLVFDDLGPHAAQVFFLHQHARGPRLPQVRADGPVLVNDLGDGVAAVLEFFGNGQFTLPLRPQRPDLRPLLWQQA